MGRTLKVLSNWTGIEAKGDKVVLLGDGPSKRKYLDDPRPLKGCSLAVLNMVYPQVPTKPDYWITQHPCLFREYRDDEELGVTQCIGWRWTKDVDVPYILIKDRQVQGGGSALFAVETLLGMGYKEVHMYGIDLNTTEYKGYRLNWWQLYGHNIIGHGGMKIDPDPNARYNLDG